MFERLYGVFSYLGVLTLAAAFIMGFRHDAGAPMQNLYLDIGLYAAFIAVHIIMTMPGFKRAVFGRPEGSPFERRIYVTISIVTWVGLYWLHQPVPGFAFVAPVWLRFVGLCATLLAIVAFFEFATFESLGSLLGMPGTELSHSTGGETPLMTQGPYASVRHPMYRAAVYLTFASCIIHPNAAQLLFTVMVSASFLGFVPFEERQLIGGRGEQYREYMRQTPYRVFHGIW